MCLTPELRKRFKKHIFIFSSYFSIHLEEVALLCHRELQDITHWLHKSDWATLHTSASTPHSLEGESNFQEGSFTCLLMEKQKTHNHLRAMCLHVHHSCALLKTDCLQKLLWPLVWEGESGKVVEPAASPLGGLGKEVLVIAKGLVDAWARAGQATGGPGCLWWHWGWG